MNSFGQNIANNIIVNDINIFNETDSYFSDFCSNFTIENVDIPLKERREMLFLGNQAKEVICHDITCEIENITINQLIISIVLFGGNTFLLFFYYLLYICYYIYF